MDLKLRPHCILSIFKKYARELSKEEVKIFPNETLCSFECEVIEVDPSFTVSDGHHAAPCNFTKAAISSFISANPSARMKDLLHKRIVLESYSPEYCFSPEGGVTFNIIVNKFSLSKSSADTKILDFPIKEDPELIPYIEILEQRSIAKLIAESGRLNELPDIEDLETTTMQKFTVAELSKNNVGSNVQNTNTILYKDIEKLELKVVEERKQMEIKDDELPELFTDVPTISPTIKEAVGKLIEKNASAENEKPKARLVKKLKLNKGESFILTKGVLDKYMEWRSLINSHKETDQDLTKEIDDTTVGYIEIELAKEKPKAFQNWTSAEKRTAASLGGIADDSKRKKL